MRRSRLGPGKKALERGSTFAKHGGKPKAKPPPAERPGESEGRRAWWQGAEDALCVACGTKGCDPHHIILEQRCRRRARSHGVPEWRYAYDRRNRLWTCRRHHRAHHDRSKPLTLELLGRYAPKVFQFAREIGEMRWLEAMYPKETQREEQQCPQAPK